MSKVLTSMLYIHPLGCDVYRLAWAIVCYKWVGSPEPQRGNYNSSHATFFVYILALGTGRGVNIIHMTEPSKDFKKCFDEEDYCLFKVVHLNKDVSEELQNYDSQTYAYIRYKDGAAILAYFNIEEREANIITDLKIINNKENNCNNRTEIHYVFAAYTIYGDSEYINKNFRYEKFPFRIAANPKIPIMDEYYKEVIAAINEKIEQYEV